MGPVLTPGSAGPNPPDDGAVDTAGRLRLRLCATGMALFRTRGLAAVTLRGVARHSGVGREATARCFADKHALLDAMWQRVLQEAAAQARAAASGEPEPRARRERAIRACVGYFAAHADAFRLGIALHEAGALGPADGTPLPPLLALADQMALALRDGGPADAAERGAAPLAAADAGLPARLRTPTGPSRRRPRTTPAPRRRSPHAPHPDTARRC